MLKWSWGAMRNAVRTPVRLPPLTSWVTLRLGCAASIQPPSALLYPAIRNAALAPTGTLKPSFDVLPAEPPSIWLTPTSPNVLVTPSRSEEHTSELQSRRDLV